MQITDLSIEEKISPIWRMGFRPLFLFPTLYLVLISLRWILTLAGVIDWPYQTSVIIWHSHEFLFGFGFAIVIGFLITAVQTWTGQRSLHGTPLMLLTCFWLAARLNANLNWDQVWLTAAFDTLFTLQAMIAIAQRLIATNNKRNLIFIPILTLFLVLGIALLWANNIQDVLLARNISYAVVLIFIFLISLLGGRVIPFFISRKLGIEQVKEAVWLTAIAQVSLLILAYAVFTNSKYIEAVSLLVFLIQGWRIFKWHDMKIWQHPLLWSLWLAYAYIPLACAVLFFFGVNWLSPVIHILTLGTISGLILSMMARVSLGHSGRPLDISTWMTVAFVTINLATLVRAVLPLFSQIQLPVWYLHLAMSFYLISFSIFCICYSNIMFTARADGHPG
ncbi:NnrS family protein [Catenovulum maritimum]|uniref:NnrS family protein n=1 Tax=Catenovulum maritimum TaxID=1513271 RepID=UPI0006601645|nr:NnrS family protein [Catenovulum maritimum]